MFGWTGPELQNDVFLVRGPYNMMSIFMRVLITPKGEVIGRPNEGTELLDMISEGSAGDSSELQGRLSEILDDAFEQTQQIQQNYARDNELPADEILVSYRIANFFASSDGEVSRASIELANAAGQTVSGLIPLAAYTL